jgi:Skp family chaperone for outer membrane proteins
MKTLLIAIPLAIVVGFLSSEVAGQTPAPLLIAYVSSQRIFAEATDAKAQVARFGSIQQQKAAELKAKQQALDATRQQLAQAGANPRRTELQQQEQREQADLQQATTQAQAELQALQQGVQRDVQKMVKAALDDVAKARKVQIVLNSDSAVIWAAPGLDLTDVVLERLNAGTAPGAQKH